MFQASQNNNDNNKVLVWQRWGDGLVQWWERWTGDQKVESLNPVRSTRSQKGCADVAVGVPSPRVYTQKYDHVLTLKTL